MVDDVESIHAELEVQCLMNLELFRHGSIEVNLTRCTVRVARNVAEASSDDSRSHSIDSVVNRAGCRQREVRIGRRIVVLQRRPIQSWFRQLQTTGISVRTLR